MGWAELSLKNANIGVNAGSWGLSLKYQGGETEKVQR